MEQKPLMDREQFSPADISAQIQLIQTVMKDNMKNGEHYGIIPNCGKKPSLLKAGAEKLGFLFRFRPEFDVAETDLGAGHKNISVKCRLIHIPTGKSVGEGVGSCSTMETKYRYRAGESKTTGKLVPKEYWDNRATDIEKAKEAIGGKGFGVKKLDGVWQIIEIGEPVENPCIADVWNTVVKMAKKRAFVDATITATAASDIFTQDIEDFGATAAEDTATDRGAGDPAPADPAPAQGNDAPPPTPAGSGAQAKGKAKGDITLIHKISMRFEDLAKATPLSSAKDIRDCKLAYCGECLGLKAPLISSATLTDQQALQIYNIMFKNPETVSNFISVWLDKNSGEGTRQ
jgi:hypothetical protein